MSQYRDNSANGGGWRTQSNGRSSHGRHANGGGYRGGGGHHGNRGRGGNRDGREQRDRDLKSSTEEVTKQTEKLHFDEQKSPEVLSGEENDDEVIESGAHDSKSNGGKDEELDAHPDRKIALLSPEDPEYNEQATVLSDPANFSIKHPLQHKWTLWYDNPGKKTSQDKWDECLKKIISFDTVEDFWGVFNNIQAPSKLSPGSDYHLFKDDIEPKWEHAENAKGGKWIITLKSNKEKLDELWLFSCLACIGESLDDEDEVCGLVISLRKGGDRISLWTRTATNEVACRRLGAQFKRVLELSESQLIGYQVHADSLKRGSSFNNRNRYEL